MNDTSSLNAPGPQNEEFIKWCGRLDPYSMPPDRRLSLWYAFQAAQSKPTANPAADLRVHLVAKYGSVEAAPAVDRARLSDLEPKPAAPVVPPLPNTPALQGMTAGCRYALDCAHRQRAQLFQYISRLEGSNPNVGFNVLNARHREIEKAQAKIAGLEQLYPEILGVA